jgi:hypothetical protein
LILAGVVFLGLLERGSGKKVEQKVKRWTSYYNGLKI